MFGAFWHAVAKPGRKQEFLDFLDWDVRVAKETEPGTISFDAYEDSENPDGVYVYESYQDEPAFGKHRSHEPFQKFFPGGLRAELLADLTIVSGFSTALVSKG